METANEGSPTTRCHLVVRGEVGAALLSVLDGVSIRSAQELTGLSFDVKDSSHLDAILDRLRDFDIDIVSGDVASEPGAPQGSASNRIL